MIPISNQQTSTSGNSNDGLGGFSGFGITQTGPWQSKQKAYLYDPSGKFLQEIEPSNPNARDYGELAAKLIVAIAGGGAAASAMGGAAAGAGGFGAEGGMAGGAVGAGGGGAAGSAIGTAAGSAAGGVGTMPTLPLVGTEGLATIPEFGAAGAAGGGAVGTLPSLEAFSTAGGPSALPEFSASGLGGGISAGGVAKAGGGLASAAGAGGGGGGGSSGTPSKAALDGTNSFGANSAPNALDISALQNAAPGSPAANAVADLAKSLGYSDSASFLTQLKSMGSDALSSIGSLIPGGWQGLLGAGLSYLGGKQAVDASSAAANAQLQGVRESNALLKAIYDDQKALQEPFRQNGLAAGNRLDTLLGIGGDKTSADYGSAARNFTSADFLAGQDPGYQWRISQGEKALQRAASAGAGIQSGKYLKDAMDYNQNQASQEYQNAYNRFQTNRAAVLNPLQSMYGSGQSAANTVTSAAGNYGNNASNNITSGANAQAAGIVGRGNAWNNAISQGLNTFSQNELMNRLMQPSAYGSYGGYGGISNPYVS